LNDYQLFNEIVSVIFCVSTQTSLQDIDTGHLYEMIGKTSLRYWKYKFDW